MKCAGLLESCSSTGVHTFHTKSAAHSRASSLVCLSAAKPSSAACSSSLAALNESFCTRRHPFESRSGNQDSMSSRPDASFKDSCCSFRVLWRCYLCDGVGLVEHDDRRLQPRADLQCPHRSVVPLLHTSMVEQSSTFRRIVKRRIANAPRRKGNLCRGHRPPSAGSSCPSPSSSSPPPTRPGSCCR